MSKHQHVAKQKKFQVHNNLAVFKKFAIFAEHQYPIIIKA